MSQKERRKKSETEAMKTAGTMPAITARAQTGTRSDVAKVCWIEVSLRSNCAHNQSILRMRRGDGAYLTSETIDVVDDVEHDPQNDRHNPICTKGPSSELLTRQCSEQAGLTGNVTPQQPHAPLLGPLAPPRDVAFPRLEQCFGKEPKPVLRTALPFLQRAAPRLGRSGAGSRSSDTSCASAAIRR